MVRTRTIVYAGLIAAVYIVLTILLAPISFGPLQFRISNFVKPLAMVSPVFALAFMVGTAVANLTSPFGIWDFGIMPFVELVSCLLAYVLRKVPLIALLVQSAVIAMGVAFFPLGMMLKTPFLETSLYVFVPQVVILVGAWFFIWRKYLNFVIPGVQD